MKTKSVAIPLVGGLGNQLFCLAYAIKLHKSFSTGVSVYSSVRRQHTKFHASHFDFVEHWPDLEGYPKFIVGWRRLGLELVAKSSGILGQLAFVPKEISQSLVETKTAIVDIAPPENSPCIVRGYFHSADYDQSTINSVRRAIVEACAESSFAQTSIISGLKPEKGMIGLHFRRGDYASHQDSLGMLALNYFLDGCNIIRTNHGARKVMIYSDGQCDDLKNLLVGHDFEVEVFNDTGLNPLSVMLHMSTTAAYLVISNSSFSWWAAAVGQQIEVVFPFPWFKDLSVENLGRVNWTPLESKWQESNPVP